MGIGKREHIAALLADPEIACAWREQYDAAPTAADGDRLYEEFASDPGARGARARADDPRGAGDDRLAAGPRSIAIATNTGYFRQVLDAILPVATEQGL
jgi:phosphonoacetaldehyde hydrolase